MLIKICRLTFSYFLLLLSTLVHAQEDAIEFDVGTLKARGLPEGVAEYFKVGKRFTPGSQRVELSVNGASVGFVQVLFDASGQPCLDRPLLEKSGIKISDDLLKKAPQGCISNMQDFYPRASVKLFPGQERVELVVPTDALVGPLATSGNFSQGGMAGVFNYDINGLTNHDEVSSSSFVQGGTEIGVNADDWIVRSRQTFNVSGVGGSSVQHLYAYAQRSFNDSKSVFQGGELYVGNSLFNAPQIIGFQVFPEGVLRSNSRSSGAMVSGIAQSQARVEVRQAGVIIYSTIVPAGPFSLSNLPLVTSNADLYVTVIEQGGTSHSFIVPYISLVSGFVAREEGWSAALGKIQNSGGTDLRTQNLASLSGVTSLGKKVNISGGGLVSENFRSLGVGLDSVLPMNISTSGKVLISGDSRSGTNGVQLSASGSMPVTEHFSINLSTSQRSAGYREITSVPLKQRAASTYHSQVLSDNLYSSQYSMGVGFGNFTQGNFRLDYSHTSSSAGAESKRYIASWSKIFRKLSVQTTLERDDGLRQATLAYLSISFPLGDVRVGSNVQYANHSASYGVSADQQVNDYMGYNIATSADSTRGDASLSGTVRLLPKYSSLSLGASCYGNSNTYSGSASGGMVLHSGGLSFSPYPVQDTFALVDVPGLSGARIKTPQGPVWTDWKGSAVAANMPPYYEDRLELATENLPRNIDVQNGLQITRPGRGSVGKYSFKLLTNRRVLLHTRDSTGRYVPKGEAIVNSQDQYVATVGGEGAVFLSDEPLLKVPLYVRSFNKQLCQLSFTLPEKAPEDGLYEEVDAVCGAIVAPPPRPEASQEGKE